MLDTCALRSTDAVLCALPPELRDARTRAAVLGAVSGELHGVMEALRASAANGARHTAKRTGGGASTAATAATAAAEAVKETSAGSGGKRRHRRSGTHRSSRRKHT